MGHGAAVPDPRPGRRIRAIVPLDRDGDGRGRGRYGATEPVAKSVCGTPDRQREARMPGPFDHPQRAAFAAHFWLIPRLLSRFKDPPVDRQGHTGWTTRSAGRVRNGRFLAQGRRSASSLRTPRGLTTPARIRSIPLCGDVDAAGIRMPLYRFAATIRRNKHRDDLAHGRLQKPLAQNGVRAGEPSRRWEVRWNKWKGQPSQTWRTFLENHVGCLASTDFFVVPTATFSLLFVLVVLRHERRRIVHIGTTAHPTAAWVAQQIREAFPWETAPRYMIRDRDRVYGIAFRSRIKAMAIEEVVTAPRSPWQSPYVERVIGSIRRECLDHVIVLNERHLRAILLSYIDYYQRSRTHLALGKDTPERRSVQPAGAGKIVAFPQVGGLHHRYQRLAA